MRTTRGVITVGVNQIRQISKGENKVSYSVEVDERSNACEQGKENVDSDRKRRRRGVRSRRGCGLPSWQ